MEVSNFKMKGNTITVKDATARSSIADINTSIGTINKNIGDISTLPTTDKSSIVNSITELDEAIASIKAPSYESSTESIVFE